MISAKSMEEKNQKFNPLTPEEERVIVHKGTERPFSGEYDDFNQKGTFVCRRCDAPLYRSQDKFNAGCGWPSFDAELPEAVRRIPDADGMRTEIVCNNCGAHLGHVFFGEKLTEKNTRHCVNSISIKFKPMENDPQTAYFAGGCFWGVEYYFQHLPGVVSTRVGYMGGDKADPTYEEVSSGKTGHAETLEVVFDRSGVSYEELAKLFFEIHDPTQKDRQGPDIGTQYRSAIFWSDEEQRKTAEKLIRLLGEKGYSVVTALEKAGPFWEAEDYHQKYYAQNGHQPYCHIRRKIFD